MILERRMQLDIPDLQQQFGDSQNNFRLEGFDNPRTAILEFARLIQMYNSAMKEVSGRFN